MFGCEDSQNLGVPASVMALMGSRGAGQACACGLPSPGCEDEGPEHPDKVMSEWRKSSWVLGAPLLSSRCFRLSPPYPMV